MADKDFKVKNGIDVAGNANISGNLNAAKYQTSAPSSPVTGQIWIDSDASASVINTNDFLLKADFDLQSIPIGGVTQYAGATSPSANWAICDGTAVSRTTYATLFARIGTTYGVGNGTTTFNLPNVKGKVIAGLDSTQTEFDALAETGGAKTHTLTSAEMPSHTHIQNAHGHVVSANSFAGDLEITMGPVGGDGNKYSVSDSINDASSTTANIYARNTTATNQNTGSGGAHNNLQPYIVMNYLIRMA
jgi:microcystin-dependent protein